MTQKPDWNEGSVIEGLFALAAGLYLQKGTMENDQWVSKLNATDVNNMREKVNPNMWLQGSSVINLIEDEKEKFIKLEKKGKQPDYIRKIQVSIKLKYGEAGEAYGQENLITPDSLNEKIKTLVETFPQLTVGQKLTTEINEILKNAQSEYMDWFIEADGVGGEKSGGTIKGDVVIKLNVNYSNKDGKLVNSQKKTIAFSYSLKSDSKTWGNFSPWNKTIELIRDFKLDTMEELDIKTLQEFAKNVNAKPTKMFQNEDKSKVVLIPNSWKTFDRGVPNCYVMTSNARSQDEKTLKQKEALKTIQALHVLIQKKLVRVKNSSQQLGEFSSKWWELLATSGTGTDYAEIIDIKKKSVIQVKTKALKEMVTGAKEGKGFLLSKVELKNNEIIFYTKIANNETPVYSLRMRAEMRNDEDLFIKLLLEYSKEGFNKLQLIEKFPLLSRTVK